MNFEQIQTTNDAALYKSEYDIADTGGTWVGFLLSQADGPTSLSLKESWVDYLGDPRNGVNGGCYLFCKSTPDDDFLERLLEYLDQLNDADDGWAYRYFLWFEDPNDAGTLTGQNLSFFNTSEDPSVGEVRQLGEISLRNFTIRFSQGVEIQLDDELESFEWRGFEGAPIELYNSTDITRNIGIITTVTLPLNEQAPGSFQFDITLIVAGENNVQNDFDSLLLGMAYFFEGTDVLKSQSYSVLGPSTETSELPFTASFDPFYALDPERTYFLFLNSEDGETPSTLTSYFRTDFGQEILLTPVAEQSRLVFAASQASFDDTTDQIDIYYSVPSGPFILAEGSGNGGDEVQLLCGLAGTETIQCRPANSDYSGDVFTFYPDRAAYAPVFPIQPVDVNDYEASSQPLLDDTYTTAWLTITPAESTDPSAAYFSQPDGGALYAETGSISEEINGFLDFFQVANTQLDTSGEAGAYPLVPYARVAFVNPVDDFTSDEIDSFESQILAPMRKQIVREVQVETGQNALSQEETTLTTATTPQGLLAEVDETGGWQTLLLAKSEDQSTGDLLSYYFQFQDLDDNLQNAFQTNQQFLVVTNPLLPWQEEPASTTAEATDESDTVFNNRLSVEGWTFDVNTGVDVVPGSYTNVLIFKFCQGSLKEKVTNPELWTSPGEFNETDNKGLTWVSQWLQDYIAEAEAQESEDYQYFVDIVNNPNWNGILALQVDINLDIFPSEIQGLLAGINTDNFYAHHIGIEVNYVTTDGGLHIEGGSSIFGLIDYIDQAYAMQVASGGDPEQPVAAATDTAYDFKVLLLKVLFQNSEILNFNSKTQLTINEWFGEKVARVTGPSGIAPSNSMVFQGSYENHNGEATYVFVNDGSTKFWLDSDVLYFTEVTKAQFSTLQDGGDDGDVLSSFNLTGYFNFRQLEGFDAFSFGSESEEEAESANNEGLYFSNIFINMDFNLSTLSNVTYGFDTGDIAFNTDNNTTRSSSLARNFPIEVTGLLSGVGEELPSDQGFLTVYVQDLAVSGVSGDWHGLALDVDMGTPGDLASSAGFSATLCLAWSPRPGTTQQGYNISVGIKLPGSSGGNSKLMSLQGVLQLAIDDINFLYVADSNAYMLKFTNIGLSFLGIKLPPGGNTLFLLFGNPDPSSARSSLGWYAAYNKDSSSQTENSKLKTEPMASHQSRPERVGTNQPRFKRFRPIKTGRRYLGRR